MLLDKTEINLEAKKLYLKKQYPALSCYINKAERHQYLQIAIVYGFIHKCPSTYYQSNDLSFLVGLAAFKAFLKSEFSQENIAFWMACEEYKKTSADKMAAKAKQIFDQYVEMDSPGEVRTISNSCL